MTTHDRSSSWQVVGKRLVPPSAIMVLTAVVLMLAAATAGFEAAEAPEDSPIRPVQRHVQDGIVIEFEFKPLDPGQSEPMMGQDARVEFRVTDTTTGSPISGLRPGAWIDPRGDVPPANAEQCVTATQAFIGASLGARAEFDLNVYYVLGLNSDASITVVDPLFGFGGSKLLALVELESPGEDWTLTDSGGRLFVTMPDSGKVAVVDPATWKTLKNVAVGTRPMRIALQPDEKYAWVGIDGEDGKDFGAGVAVLDTETLAVRQRIATGAGHHEIAFTDDSRYAFVTNRESGTVSVIDIRTLERIENLSVGKRPASVAYSRLSQAIYVTSEAEGRIVVIDAHQHQIRTRTEAEPGLTAIRFAPEGRFGFVVNTKTDTVHILDAATNRIVQSASVGAEPDQITFTDNLAYVRSRGSELILMIPLSSLGNADQPVPVIDFTGGQNPVGRAKKLSLADGIVATPEGAAVLVANPVDRTIYYYKEGMAAPMGSFQNYGHEPRAVIVVDKSLQEREPGVYSTYVKLTRSGAFNVPLFLDSPRIIHCFDLTVAADPANPERHQRRLAVERIDETDLAVDEPFRLRFAVKDVADGKPLKGLDGVEVLTFFSSGRDQRRQWARETGDGIYEIAFTPRRSGSYLAFFRFTSLGVDYQDGGHLVLRTAPMTEKTEKTDSVISALPSATNEEGR